MTTPPQPLEEMNEDEARAWKAQLANLGKRPAAFAWGRDPRPLEAHSGPVICLAMSADGKRAVSASEDGTLKVWNIDSGLLLHTLEHGEVCSLAFIRDDTQAVSKSVDTKKIWDIDS